MTIEETITKAIEGGYDGQKYSALNAEELIYLDPTFWQSLGKALGWSEGAWGSGLVCAKCGKPECGRGYWCGQDNWEKKEPWLYHWHHFIDHLAEGKSPDSFFEAL